MFGHWSWEVWVHWRPKPQLSSAEGYCTGCTPIVSSLNTQKTKPFVPYGKKKSVLKKCLAALVCFYNFQLKQPFTQQTENMDVQTDRANFTQASSSMACTRIFTAKAIFTSSLFFWTHSLCFSSAILFLLSHSWFCFISSSCLLIS